jgi:adenylylsulfate kinase
MGRIENLQDTTPQVFWHASAVTAEERLHQLRQQPATIWLTGLSGAGKSTPGLRAGTPPVRRRPLVYVLDGDNLRHHLNSDLGFSSRDRRENIRRSAEVARLLNDAGLIVICAFISPLRETAPWPRPSSARPTLSRPTSARRARYARNAIPRGCIRKPAPA